ncbi:peroxisomal hydratase-dehydrogenase-epimerase [Aspergillus pseudonomiae]|uniref:Peroxisomal hydratase-dehydrogenase-epimerase n=1 Tax=Aspergillus pseudonomiae TaxID=1506151 RepID=A0A5N7CTW9_9EURO|nr:peroxisomal hydratase-dehydrogenase-epimerase [Aspergillus pseudonomiae]KAE8397594.1 peroxisomal hydratase-dehydrogenase-epimerase [Aspergillus pseudonomiae]
MALQHFSNQTVIITSCGHGLGRNYATFFASAGANVVVHDTDEILATTIARDIKATGGIAIANSSSLQNGDQTVAAALAEFGRVDIIIYNSLPEHDRRFKGFHPQDGSSDFGVAFKGLYKTVHAAWPIFRKHKFGRFISTTGLYELPNHEEHLSYAISSYAHLGFVETVAKEGVSANILAAVIVTGTPFDGPSGYQKPDRDAALGLVASLSHKLNTRATGSMYYLRGKLCHALRWERAGGAGLRLDQRFTPGAILEKWDEVNNFADSEYPRGTSDVLSILRRAADLPEDYNKEGKRVSLHGKVAIVTGAANGLGREYALLLAKLGAKVVVNDIQDPAPVVSDIHEIGQHAIRVTAPAQNGKEIVRQTVEAYGRVDIIINNAGTVRDKSIGKMTEKELDFVFSVNLDSTYEVIKAAWPYMVKQRYGRIVNITSTSGIYGNFGQANYTAAKCGLVGLSEFLAGEGAKDNIIVNVIAPTTSTPNLLSIMPGFPKDLKPAYCAPMVALLCSDRVPFPSTGAVYEVNGGWQGRTRLQRSAGSPVSYRPDQSVPAGLDRIANFDKRGSSYPEDGPAGHRHLKEILKTARAVEKIEAGQAARGRGGIYEYNHKDVILYNLGVTAKRNDLPLVLETDLNFQPVPTFGTIPTFFSRLPVEFKDILPKWNPLGYVHGEQYLEIRKYPIPTAGKLVTHSRLLEVVDKKKAAIVTMAHITRDEATGEDAFYNEVSLFVKNAGGFGGQTQPRLSNSKTYNPPQRAPDFIYPAVGRAVGFPAPILHGLCFFGISGKHILQQYGRYKSIKGRFIESVFPGQTFRTELWKEGKTVTFQTRVVETGKVCIAGGGVELLTDSQNKL